MIVARLTLPVRNCCLQLLFGLRIVTRALRDGESQPWRGLSDLAFANADARNCDKWKHGGAAHSRFAGEELDLICNHKFV